MSTVARPSGSKGPSQKKKIRVNKTEMSIIIGMAGRRGGGGRVKAQFPCIFAGDLETPWYIGECRATSCLSCSSTLSKQFPRFDSTAITQPTSSSRDKTCTLSSSVITNKLGTCARASDGTDLRDWILSLKKYIWVSTGIELYPQNGGQAAVVDAWAVHGILYSKKFSSAKNFVKSDRQAVRQEFIFVKRRVARFVFGCSVRLLIVYLHIHDYFWSHTCRFEENLVRNLI